MGQLVDGTWHDVWYDTKSTGGAFKRTNAAFRNWITADGTAGPSGEAGFPAQSGRYHLYVSYACPWADRTLIFRHDGPRNRADFVGQRTRHHRVQRIVRDHPHVQQRV